jgi:maltose O-acetyltransferase
MNLIQAIASEIKIWIGFLIIHWPESKIGEKLRYEFWKRQLKIGKNFKIERCATIGDRNKITIGNNFILGEHAQFAVGDSPGVWVGNDVAIARYTWIRTANHKYDRVDIPIQKQGHEYKVVNFMSKEFSVVIEDDVWIAPNVVILTGTHIGRGCVISANSVVSGVIPSYSIVMGNPARILANRAKMAKFKSEVEVVNG